MTKRNVLVAGCNGHMGQILCRLIDESENFKVKYAFDKTAWEYPNYYVCTDLEDIEEFGIPDIIIDFSAPEATMQLLDFSKKFKVPIVIATTGFSEDEKSRIVEASNVIPIFQSANMSFEVCLIKHVLKLIAPKLSKSDIEISETHHNRKKDAPSGTALLFAEAIKESLVEDKKKIIYGRMDKRESDEIGISSLRGGNIVGEHSIYFFGENETLEIKHSAHSRDLFAEGALKAAEFLLKQTKPGLYTMDNLISM